MYKITIQTLNGNEKTLYYPGSDEFTVLSASLSLKVGNAGEFKFTVPQSNPLYNEIVDRSIVTIYEDNTEIWRGDIQDISQNFDKSLEVYALEDLAWLGDETVPMVAVENQTYAQRFSTVMANYNDNQPAKRQFQPGTITSVTTSNFCNWQPLYEETLLECIRRCIADNGYLKVRRVTNNGTVTRYIDILLLEDYGQQAQQAIRFGSNLLDFVKEIDNTNFLNVLYPYGKETEEKLYGDIMRRIEGTPIQNDASIAVFGRHSRTVIFETDSMANLNRLALAYLNRYSQPSLKIKAKAIDLGNIEEISRMHLGDSVRIIAEPFAIDQWDYITNQELDLLNIANNQIELSDAVRVSTLTSQVATQGEEIKDIRTPASVLDEAKRNAWSIIEGDNGGIVTFDVNGNEQIVGIHIANNLDLDQATKAWGWNVNGLVYLHRTYPSDEWQIGIAMTMNGEIVADYITAGTMSADRIDGGHIRANLITALNGTTAVGNNTLADFATKASTIIDVDVEYAKNQSSTTAPTSGWSTDSPQWEEGYYIWQRTKTTDGNSQASYSTPVCIQGAKGQDGTAIASVTVTYGTSSSPNTQPSTWYNNIPSVANGDYLWIRTITDYSDTSVQDTVTYTYSRQGENGQDGTSVSVSSIQYQQGDSATTAPTGTWSNTPVTVAQGKYLWTKTTFSNGSIAYGVARQGEDGADGNGISSVTISYGTSSSASTQPSSWQTIIPTVADGDYLWIRTITDYTDPSVQDTVTFTYSRQGEDGQQGQAGTSVTVSSIQYQEGTSATSAPTGTWSNNPITVAQGNYLWTKTTFSNGSIAYGIARQGEDGTDGTDGSDGVGVSAIVEQYYLSTSDQSPTGGSWSTNQPVWVEGKYIWTRSHVTWTNGTTSDTTPVLAKAINGANQAVKDLDDDLDQNGVFNRLIGGDTAQGIVLNNGKLYLRGNYLEAGEITIGGSAFATNPTLAIKDTSNRTIVEGSKDGIKINDTNANTVVTLDENGITADAGTIGDLTLEDGELHGDGEYLLKDTKTYNEGNSSLGGGHSIITDLIPKDLRLSKPFKISVDYTVSNLSKTDTRNFRFELHQRSGNTDTTVAQTPITEVEGSYTALLNYSISNTDTYNYAVYVMHDVGTTKFKLTTRVYIDDVSVVSLSRAGIYGTFTGTVFGVGNFDSLSADTITVDNLQITDNGIVRESDDDAYKLDFTPTVIRSRNSSTQYTRLDNSDASLRIQDTANSYIDIMTGTPEINVYKSSSEYIRIKGNNPSIHIQDSSSEYLEVTARKFRANTSSSQYVEISDYPKIEAYNSSDNYIVISADDVEMRLEATSNKYAMFRGGSDLYSKRSASSTWSIPWTSSDRRNKENIEDLDAELSKNFIDATETKQFKYKDSEGKHYGMIAQDVRELLDNLGETDAHLEYCVNEEDEYDPRNINYSEYIPHLINYVKDLRSEIVSLKEEVRILKEEKNDGKH